MQVERPANRPRLDQRAIAPQRIADVLLEDSVDAGVQGELGRGLDLRVDPTRVVRDLDDALGPARPVTKLLASRRARTSFQVIVFS